MRPELKRRSDFRYMQEVTTRWMDNDAYGHVNNVVYYSWFDTAVNQLLIQRNVLDVEHGAVIGLVVETQCQYHAPVSFPDRIQVGVAVGKLGHSSVRYELAIFRNDEEVASAQGHFVHVYVNRETRRPTALPENLRAVLQTLLLESK